MPTPHERSQSGCWSCRARKKKCDEAHPICSACDVRGISCHGYGPRPAWMDGAAREKQILHEFQVLIRENLRRRRSYRATPAQHDILGPPIQHTTPAASSLPTPPSSITGPPQVPFDPYGDHASASQIAPLPDGCSWFVPPGWDEKEFETTLLMQYLDHVFPLQFSCYTPPVAVLGRGWLLALLTRTKPLYHAALALSAFYMHSVLIKTGRTTCIEMHSHVIKKHHSLAFKGLQVQIAELNDGSMRNLKVAIEAVACIVQLISFELFKGGTDCWQIHHRAASALIPMLITHLSPSLTQYPGDPGRPSPPPPPSLSAYKATNWTAGHTASPPPVSEVACDFFIGTFIWFDILASASTRCPPHLPNNIAYLTQLPIELSNIMGCESWAMILISQISTLAAWKASSSDFDVVELQTRGAEIERQLIQGLSDNETEMGVPVLHREKAPCQRLGVPQTKLILLITRVYALAALIYLECTTGSPDPSRPTIAAAVEENIAAISMFPDPVMLRNVVWPFCVTASMFDGRKDWKEGQGEQAGREALLEGPLERAGVEGKTGTLWTAWDVVQECWRLRGEGRREVDWVHGMGSLGFQILLV